MNTYGLEEIAFYEVIYIYCSENHSGQFSELYRILSALGREGFKPRPSLTRSTLEFDQ